MDPFGVSESGIKDTTVTLPEGMQLSPSGANGLESCSESLVGFTGFSEFNPEAAPGNKTATFTSALPKPLEPGVNFCSNASKIATVKIKTPLLPNPLEGSVYLASQNANPFGSLIAMYIVAEDPVSGVLVKLPGEVKLNQTTGQIETTFLNTPQLPFEDLELHFFGGETAPLSTPAACGSYTTKATFTPWSGNAPVESDSTFNITSGPHGGPCPDGLPFSPSLTAGATNIQAGAFSPFTMTMSREDGQQNLRSVQLKLPPGLSGALTGVELCPEPQADQGACGPNSLLGEATAAVGLGSDPYTVTGKAYLTGPYNGAGACAVGTPGCAPFGLSIVTPAIAGPFNLGTVVVRAKIEINPHTTELTVTTDGSGPHAIPTILDGIPLQIKRVNVTVNRSNFTFNPTNCAHMAITGSISSAEGATSALSVPFQTANCATLKFEPKFVVSTSGHTTKADGASLSVDLVYPQTPFGSQANVAKVKVDLPKQLPSRLTTLQKACTAAQFEANPSGCPAASIVGHAKAITPLLPVPLEGPAYFVSHGGEAFPNLVMVLQGYGVTVDLVGDTFISKAGVTSSTFQSVPDLPVSSFELDLPQGPYSALAANGNLCAATLAMPTVFVGQNGAEIHTSTPISATGCKPAIRVLRHKVRGKTATITVSVPQAGKLVASGARLSRATQKAKRAGDLTVNLTLSHSGQAFLARHPGRKLRAKVKLRFTPQHGAPLSTSVTVLIR